jgi:glycosyltransferase involved in cell wall biosynthesis
MKILQVVQKPQRRGAELFALQLNQHLQRMGHDVATAYLYPHDDANALPLGHHDTILGTDERHCFERIPGIHPALVSRLSRLVDERRPDVVQVNGGRTVKYGALVAARQPRRSWVLIYRNIGQLQDWMDGWRRRLYARLVAPRLDGVVGVSSATLESVREVYGTSTPAARIPCAVDPASAWPRAPRCVIRERTATPTDAPVIVWVGSLSPEKRPDRLLRVAAIVKRAEPALHVWIVGSGPLRQATETAAMASPLASCVRFLGTQDHVADYITAGDVLALTSDSEGMPAVLLEAGLAGLPVVSTRVGGVSECVVHGQTGLLLERDDEDGLADALRDLLERPAKRQLLGNAAHVWIEQNFTMSRVAQAYATFYEQVLTGSA